MPLTLTDTQRMTRDSDETPWAGPYIVVPLVAGTAVGILAALDPFRLGGGLIQAVGILSGIGLVTWTALTMGRASETLSPASPHPTRHHRRVRAHPESTVSGSCSDCGRYFRSHGVTSRRWIRWIVRADVSRYRRHDRGTKTPGDIRKPVRQIPPDCASLAASTPKLNLLVALSVEPAYSGKSSAVGGSS